MAFTVFEDPVSGALFVVLIVFGVFTIVVTALRFIAARQTKRQPSLEDWLALSSELVYLAFTAFSLAELSFVNGRNMVVLAYTDQEEYAFIRKRSYIVDQMFPVQQCLGKLSITALYRRIFGINRTYATWIYSVAAAQIVTSLIMLFVQCFQCKPVEYFWQPWIEGSCLSRGPTVVGLETPNSVLDLALVALAMVMVRSLQMPSKTIWRLRFLFGLGGLAGLLGFVKMGVSYASLEDSTYETLGLWGTLQMAFLIVCCSAPVLGPFLPKEGFWSRLSSSFSKSSLRLGRTMHQTSKTAGSSNRWAGSSKSDGSEHSQPWIYLQDEGSSSTRGLTWAAGPAPMVRGATGAVEQGHPLGTIQVQRTVDVA